MLTHLSRVTFFIEVFLFLRCYYHHGCHCLISNCELLRPQMSWWGTRLFSHEFAAFQVMFSCFCRGFEGPDIPLVFMANSLSQGLWCVFPLSVASRLPHHIEPWLRQCVCWLSASCSKWSLPPFLSYCTGQRPRADNNKQMLSKTQHCPHLVFFKVFVSISTLKCRIM